MRDLEYRIGIAPAGMDDFALPDSAASSLVALGAGLLIDSITQNLDALHERAGSTRVLHVHGELAWARGTHVANADKVLVVGTSLSVYPAAGLVHAARDAAVKVLNSLDMESVPRGFDCRAGRATEVVPKLGAEWLR